MAKSDFFGSFHPDTKLKLDIFRDYIRAWLPVFLTKSKNTSAYPEVLIIDGFCGQGLDHAGESGTPIIILEEIDAYYQTNGSIAASTAIRLLFNDKETEYIKSLREKAEPLISKIVGRKVNLSVQFESFSFLDFWQKNRSLVQRRLPSLVILDQFGFRDLSREVLEDLTTSEHTDFLAFMASTFLKRFASADSFQDKAPFDLSVLKGVENSNIHRAVCEQYRKLIPDSVEYHLAPFSIQKTSNHANIYGVIFGSGNIRGLEKFLNVAWKHDEYTGEKNFAATTREKDYRHRQNYLPDLDIDNRPEKIVEFENALLDFIKEKQPSNVDIYIFTLEHGFIVPIVNDILRSLQKNGKITVRPILPQQKIRQGAFYIAFNNGETVVFEYNPGLF